jgi:hypothetical protein
MVHNNSGVQQQLNPALYDSNHLAFNQTFVDLTKNKPQELTAA